MAGEAVAAARDSAAQLAQIAAESNAQLAAIAAEGSAKIRVLAVQGVAAQVAAAQKGAIDSVAAQNAAMASLIQLQAKGAQERAKIAAQGAQAIALAEKQGEQARLTAAQAAAAKLAQIEAQRAARSEAAAHKTAAAQAAGSQKIQDAGEALSEAAGRIPGPLGAVQNALAKLGPQGQAAAMALGLVTAGVTALIGVIVGGMSTAIGVFERITAKLAGFSALAGGTAAGKVALATISKLSEALPFSTSQISQWGAALLAAGVPAEKLASRIKAIAAAEAIMRAAGGGGGAAAEDLFKKLSAGGPEAEAFMKKLAKNGKAAEAELKRMGLTIAELGGKAALAKMTAEQLAEAVSKALQKKGAGPLAAMSGELDTIAMKAKEGLFSLFAKLGPSVEPFMKAVKELFGEFNKGSPIMKAAQSVITAVFSTLFAWATKAVTFIHSAFQQVVIAILTARIALDPLIKTLQKMAAQEPFIRGLKVGLALLAVPFVVLAVAVGVVLSLFSILIAVVGFVAYGFIRLAGSIVGAVIGAFNRVKAIVKGFALPSLATAAYNMVASFVSGILSRIGSVMASMRQMGAAAKSALFGALGIASPSKIAVEAAQNVTGSFADKVDDGKGKTQAAFAGLVKVPPPGTGGSSSSGGSAGLVAALDRVANVLELSPTFREMLVAAFAEAERAGDSLVST